MNVHLLGGPLELAAPSRDRGLRRWEQLVLAINETWWRRCPPGLGGFCQIFKKSAVLGRTRAKKAPRPLWLLLLFQSVPTRHLSMPGHFCAFFAQVRPVPHFFEKNLTELCLSWRASPAILAGLASFRVLFPPRGSSLQRGITVGSVLARLEYRCPSHHQFRERLRVSTRRPCVRHLYDGPQSESLKLIKLKSSPDPGSN